MGDGRRVTPQPGLRGGDQRRRRRPPGPPHRGPRAQPGRPARPRVRPNPSRRPSGDPCRHRGPRAARRTRPPAPLPPEGTHRPASGGRHLHRCPHRRPDRNARGAGGHPIELPHPPRRRLGGGCPAADRCGLHGRYRRVGRGLLPLLRGDGLRAQGARPGLRHGLRTRRRSRPPAGGILHRPRPVGAAVPQPRARLPAASRAREQRALLRPRRAPGGQLARGSAGPRARRP